MPSISTEGRGNDDENNFIKTNSSKFIFSTNYSQPKCIIDSSCVTTTTRSSNNNNSQKTTVGTKEESEEESDAAAAGQPSIVSKLPQFAQQQQRQQNNQTTASKQTTEEGDYETQQQQHYQRRDPLQETLANMEKINFDSNDYEASTAADRDEFVMEKSPVPWRTPNAQPQQKYLVQHIRRERSSVTPEPKDAGEWKHNEAGERSATTHHQIHLLSPTPTPTNNSSKTTTTRTIRTRNSRLQPQTQPRHPQPPDEQTFVPDHHQPYSPSPCSRAQQLADELIQLQIYKEKLKIVYLEHELREKGLPLPQRY